MINTILYDLDGVLVDAVDIHKNSFIQAFYEVTGHEISDNVHNEFLNGLPTKEKLRVLAEDLDLGWLVASDDEEAINTLKQAKTIKLINQQMFTDLAKRQLHFWAKDRGFKLACVTNCSRLTAELMLEKTGQLELLDLVITNDDVKLHKPHPEPYLKAMSILHSLPEECLVVEDTAKGLEAGTAAGCKVLFVNGPKAVTITNIEWMTS